MKSEEKDYSKYYNDDSFLEKITKYAKKAGVGTIEKVLYLYYAAEKPSTPAWAKATIYGALGYFIFPVDAIPDVLPIVGYSDDVGVLGLAITSVSFYIDEDVKQKAKNKLQDWFGK